MNIFTDWKFWIVVVSFIKDFVLVLGIVLVKFNDLRHLSLDMEKTTKILDRIDKRLIRLEKNQTAMKAVCAERHNK